jgi:hypothetical protein
MISFRMSNYNNSSSSLTTPSQTASGDSFDSFPPTPGFGQSFDTPSPQTSQSYATNMAGKGGTAQKSPATDPAMKRMNWGPKKVAKNTAKRTVKKKGPVLKARKATGGKAPKIDLRAKTVPGSNLPATTGRIRKPRKLRQGSRLLQ